MMASRCLLHIIALICLPLLIVGQVEAILSTDTSHYLVGDDIILSAEVSPVLQGASIADRVDLVDSLTKLQVLMQGEWRQEDGLFRNEYILGAYDTGIQVVILPIIYTVGDRSDTISNAVTTFHIQGVALDSTGLAPIKDIIEEPLTLRDYLPFLAGIAIIALVFGLIYLFIRKRRKQQTPVEEVLAPIVPEELAWKQLTQLREEKLWQQGKVKEYQSRLTHIVREYIENAYPIRALELPTSEILQAFEPFVLDPQDKKDLQEMLNMADLVKFAKGTPAITIHDEFMEKAESFVDRTSLQRKTARQQQKEEEE